MKKVDDDYLIEDALSFEASVKSMYEKSNKRAWIVALISVFITFLLAIAILFMLPLKTVEPYVIKVDKNGMVDIISTIKEKEIVAEESLDKYFVSEYVKKREGYFFDLLDSDYKYVQLFSGLNIVDEYRKIYDGKNNRADKLGNKYEVRVKILSITLGNSNGTKIATVRAEVNSINIGSKEINTETKVISVSYDYFPEDKANEEMRLLNPLSFKILSYRIDNEVK